MYRFVPTDVSVVKPLLSNLKQDHIEELEALSSQPIDKVVTDTILGATEAWACYHGETLLCVFGVSSPSVLSTKMCPWLLATNEVDGHKKAFIKATKIGVKHWKAKYGHLVNVVPLNYDKAVRWIKWLGFEVTPINEKFCRIEMR